MEEWIELKCEDCNSYQDIEFSTGDGDEPLSRIFCGSCSGHWKGYVIRRGYWIEFEDYFGPAHCQECENKNLNELRVPKNGYASAHMVRCITCIKEELDTEESSNTEISDNSESMPCKKMNYEN